VIVFLVLIVVLLIGLTTAAVMGRIGGFMAEATSSRSFVGVPGGQLSTEDIAHLHFDQALRGYRMEQVDEVLDALTARLRDLESDAGSRPLPGDSPRAAGDPGRPGTKPQEP
jgi:DivIVA domain-containing protein